MLENTLRPGNPALERKTADLSKRARPVVDKCAKSAQIHADSSVVERINSNDFLLACNRLPQVSPQACHLTPWLESAKNPQVA